MWADSASIACFTPLGTSGGESRLGLKSLSLSHWYLCWEDRTGAPWVLDLQDMGSTAWQFKGAGLLTHQSKAPEACVLTECLGKPCSITSAFYLLGGVPKASPHARKMEKNWEGMSKNLDMF